MAMQLRSSGRRPVSPPPAPRGDLRRSPPQRSPDGDDGEDRISSLPEELLHNVLLEYLLIALFFIRVQGHTPAERTFTQEVARLPVNEFSVLELSIRTGGHVFGPLLLHLLLIRTSIQRLKLVLMKNFVPECSENCDCDQDGNWRNQEISLRDLQDVKVQGFSAADHEVDFLQLVFRSAPILKTMNVQLSDEVSPSDEGCQKLHSIFEANASVKCKIYDKSGDMILFA